MKYRLWTLALYRRALAPVAFRIEDTTRPHEPGYLRQGLGHHDEDQTKLAMSMASLKHIKVDTDNNGVVLDVGTQSQSEGRPGHHDRAQHRRRESVKANLKVQKGG
jgi:hypothetical protein